MMKSECWSVAPVVLLCVAALLAPERSAYAQMIPPPGGGVIVLLPAPPPPPSLAVPKVPKLDAAPNRPSARLPKSSFSDRVIRCLDDATASRLSPGDRATYSRMCANR